MAQTATWFRQQLQRFGLEGLQKYYGMYRAFVTDNKDPEQLGRLKLEIPQIYGKETHDYWAWSVGMSAGNNVGFFAVPNIGDMVWVSFENGDPTYPIWFYGHFAKGDMMDKAKADYPEKKVMRTTSGNYMMFDDKNKLIEFEQADGTGIDIQKNKVNLGKIGNAAQPVLLGDDAVTKLEDMCSRMEDICDQMTSLTVLTPVGVSSVPVNSPAITGVKTAITALKSTLVQIKSQIVRTE